jgi:hypothetical protein
VAGSEVLGSIEYGVAVLGCPLVVVLGHDSCGAVGAASAALEDGVTPSVLAARAAGRVEPEEILAEHVHQTVDLLLERSRELADRVDTGQAAVVGLCYRLADDGIGLRSARSLNRALFPRAYLPGAGVAPDDTLLPAAMLRDRRQIGHVDAAVANAEVTVRWRRNHRVRRRRCFTGSNGVSQPRRFDTALRDEV